MPILTRNIIISFGITVLLISTVIFSISYLNHQRVTALAAIEDQLSTDTLSIETQYALLENAPCSSFIVGSSTEDTLLSQEVSNLGDKLSYTENRLGEKDPQVIQLKQQYTLLEIRDYLLTERLSSTCHVQPTIVLYFYTNGAECKDICDRAGYNLSYLHQTYPGLRVYSFDYNLNLGALKTLISIEKVQPKFPAFVINGKPTYGFTDLAALEKEFPPSLFATSTATSTKSK
jgi:hypothetical protein